MTTIENAMVLAAGLGTRMRPITDSIPKPLVPVAGRPMIDYVLDALDEAGVRKAVVNVHHHAQQMEHYLQGRQHPAIIISDERDRLLDSGGGLKKGLGYLPSGPVLVMNADLFWIGKPADEASNLRRLASFFDPAVMDMALLCVVLENTTGHNGKRDFSLAGDGRLSRFREGDPSPVVYAGAIAMNSSLLDDMPEGPFSLNTCFDTAIAAGRLHGILLHGHWLTVGTPEAIGDAERTIAGFTTQNGS